MLALVEIAGQQFEVKKDSILNVPHIAGSPGANIEFSNILLTDNNNQVSVGTPFIKGMVSCKILEQGRDKKVLVFHKKRRKGYRKLNGYRSKFTRIQVVDINI